MNKFAIILLSAAVAITTGFLVWTSIKTKQRSDELVSRFKEIDSSLQVSNEAIDKSNTAGRITAAENIYPLAVMKSQLLLLIDSLKDNYVTITEAATAGKLLKQLKPGYKRLLLDMQQCNAFKWTMADSRMPDTIQYWIQPGKFTEAKWLAALETESKEESLTYLNFLRNQIQSMVP